MLNIVDIFHFQTSPSNLLRGTGYRKYIERDNIIMVQGDGQALGIFEG
jgi:hypothetical protein